VFVQIVPFGQFQYAGLVDGRDEGEVELVQGPEIGEAGLGDETLPGVLLPLGDLGFEEAQQKVLVGTVVPGGLLG